MCNLFNQIELPEVDKFHSNLCEISAYVCMLSGVRSICRHDGRAVLCFCDNFSGDTEYFWKTKAFPIDVLYLQRRASLYVALSLVGLWSLLPEAWNMLLVSLRNAEILMDIILQVQLIRNFIWNPTLNMGQTIGCVAYSFVSVGLNYQERWEKLLVPVVSKFILNMDYKHITKKA